MSDSGAPGIEHHAEGPKTVRDLLARDGWPAASAATATLVVELSAYLCARAFAVPTPEALVACLAVTAIWVALAAPVFCAGGATTIGAALRGLSVVDASAIALLLVWLAARPYLTFLATAKIYCVLAATGLASWAIVDCAQRTAQRYVLAVFIAVVSFVVLAGPFWIGGVLNASSPETARVATAVTVHANPFYAMVAALPAETPFVWHLSDMMYGRTRIGEYTPAPEPRWYAAAAIYASLAGIAVAAGLLYRFTRRGRRRAVRSGSPEGPDGP